MIRLDKKTGAQIRFIIQLLIAIFQIIVVAGLVYPYMMNMLEMHQMYLEYIPEAAMDYLLYFIGLVGLLLMGIMHAVWRIIDNIVTWHTTD